MVSSVSVRRATTACRCCGSSTSTPPGRLILEHVEGNERAARFYRARGFTRFRRDPPAGPGDLGHIWMERTVTGQAD